MKIDAYDLFEYVCWFLFGLFIVYIGSLGK